MRMAQISVNCNKNELTVCSYQVRFKDGALDLSLITKPFYPGETQYFAVLSLQCIFCFIPTPEEGLYDANYVPFSFHSISKKRLPAGVATETLWEFYCHSVLLQCCFCSLSLDSLEKYYFLGFNSFYSNLIKKDIKLGYNQISFGKHWLKWVLLLRAFNKLVGFVTLGEL